MIRSDFTLGTVGRDGYRRAALKSASKLVSRKRQMVVWTGDRVEMDRCGRVQAMPGCKSCPEELALGMREDGNER